MHQTAHGHNNLFMEYYDSILGLCSVLYGVLHSTQNS